MLGIERNDFQIVSLAKREQRILRTAAGMDAAECGANAGALLDKGDAAVEIGTAEQNVIKYGGTLFFSAGSPAPEQATNAAPANAKKARREFPVSIGYKLRDSTSRWSEETRSTSGRGPRSPLLRCRTLTAPASASFGPTTNM